MVTSDLRVWFIEANNYPLWPTGSKRIDHFMNAMGVSNLVVYGHLYYLIVTLDMMSFVVLHKKVRVSFRGMAGDGSCMPSLRAHSPSLAIPLHKMQPQRPSERPQNLNP